MAGLSAASSISSNACISGRTKGAGWLKLSLHLAERIAQFAICAARIGNCVAQLDRGLAYPFGFSIAELKGSREKVDCSALLGTLGASQMKL
jgi:hypothetical protein